jgi:hypothetical protein
MIPTCALVLAVVAGLRGTWSPCGLSMVSSINPFSEAGRGHRYAVTCAWFVLGATLGGLVLGGAMAALAMVVPSVAALGAGAALVTVAADAGLVRIWNHPRQVNEAWLRTYRPWAYASGFGFQIGTGFTTYIMTAATYLLVAVAALAGPSVALLAGATFGLVRGLAVLLGAFVRSPSQLLALHRRLEQLGPLSLRVAMVVQTAVCVALGGLWCAVLLGAGAGAVVVRQVLRQPGAELVGREGAGQPPALSPVAAHR